MRNEEHNCWPTNRNQNPDQGASRDQTIKYLADVKQCTRIRPHEQCDLLHNRRENQDGNGTHGRRRRRTTAREKGTTARGGRLRDTGAVTLARRNRAGGAELRAAQMEEDSRENERLLTPGRRHGRRAQKEKSNPGRI
jgi:hypothetical protein